MRWLALTAVMTLILIGFGTIVALDIRNGEQKDRCAASLTAYGDGTDGQRVLSGPECAPLSDEDAAAVVARVTVHRERAENEAGQ